MKRSAATAVAGVIADVAFLMQAFQQRGAQWRGIFDDEQTHDPRD